MSIEIGPPHVDELKPRITVIGVGGAGCNAIANMIGAQVEGVDFIVANTDAQALNASPAERRIQLGPHITEGLGAGSRPDIGRAAAEETIEEVRQALEGVHMCFLAAGMGGGTGTGAAPVIAKAAREMGVLTVGVVTKPFTFEGTRRMRSADSGIEELQKHVDTLIVIPNQNLFLIASPNTTFKEAFQMADEVLQQGVRGITDLMVMPGLINLDFADVRSVMEEMGKAMMGTGESDGDGRALEAAEKAIANPLLDGVSMRGAKGVIVSITGGEDMRLMEVDEAANHIRELVDPDANIIWGSAFNPALDGKIRVSVVATGIDSEANAEDARSQPFRLGAIGAAGAGGRDAPESVPEPMFEQPAARTAPEPDPVVPVAEADAEPDSGELEDVPAARSFMAEPTATALAADAASLNLEPPLARSAHEETRLRRPVSENAPIRAPSPPPAARFDDISGKDELVLGPAFQPEPVKAPTAAKKPATKPSGGTLFERMSQLARGNARGGEGQEREEEDDGDFEVPRFLNRQNNQ